MKGALSGVRILEFAMALAGPIATMVMASLGAEVIKVESSRRFDMTRRPSGQVPLAAASSLRDHGDYWGMNAPGFQTVNREKLGIALNLQHPEGIALVKELVAISDAVVENFRPGVMVRLGLGYEALRAVKPDLVMLSCSFLGGAPRRNYAGYAPMFTALSGLGELSGYRDGPAAEIRYAADTIVAFNNALALAAALVHRQQTGQGSYIDVSCVEAVASVVADSFLDYTANGRVQRRQGNDDEPMAPHNCYPCQGEDCWVSIAVGTEAEWRGFCRALGEPAWTRAPQFGDLLSRWQHREELDRRVAEWTRPQTAEAVTDLLQRHGVAAFPVCDASALFGNPHAEHRDIASTVEDAEGRALCVARLGGKLSRTPLRAERGGPCLGEHNGYVFGKLLGLPESRIAELEAAGVLV